MKKIIAFVLGLFLFGNVLAAYDSVELPTKYRILVDQTMDKYFQKLQDQGLTTSQIVEKLETILDKIQIMQNKYQGTTSDKIKMILALLDYIQVQIEEQINVYLIQDSPGASLENINFGDEDIMYWTVVEVSMHDMSDQYTDCWVIAQDKVYDITSFVPQNDTYICGTDASDYFANTDTNLSEYYVGEVDKNFYYTEE